MSDFGMVVIQTRYQMLTLFRNSRMMIFGIFFPVFFLVLFNSAFTSGKNAHTDFAGASISTRAYFTAGMSAYAITMQTFSSLLISVTDQRESGQLKRLRGTPMPAWTFLVATALRALVLAAAMVVALLVIGSAAYGVKLHAAGVVGVVVYTVLGSLAMGAIGIAATTIARSADAAASVGPFAAVILSFTSGVFLPFNSLPSWLQAIGRVFPLEHLADGLQRALVFSSGTGLNTNDLTVLAAWAVGGLMLCNRRFKWEPQSVRG